MDLKERIQLLCKQNQVSMNKLETDLEFGKGYISKLGKSTPNIAKLQKIADYFGVSLDYLSSGKSSELNESVLTKKDERDIQRDLDRIMGEIRKGDNGPLYYNGVEISDASVNLLQNAIEFALRETKISFRCSKAWPSSWAATTRNKGLSLGIASFIKIQRLRFINM